ncbi:MAG: hypothetical protein ABSE04_02640 [Candidatus Microgenomates bacterium]
MNKLITITLIISTLSLIGAGRVYAQNESDSSASLKTQSESTGFDYRVENLTVFLEKYDSPLAPYAQDIVAYADENGLDYRLVPAISGVESTFGKFIPSNSYNAYGWVNGDYTFKSWPDSINVVSSTLKANYIDRGAVSIPQIAKRYAPPSTTWGGNVKYFVSQIDTLPLNFDII